jgi:tetratricopeptide (TPR) repeat protein
VTAALRSAGLRSLEMEERERIPLIPVSDAIYRMKTALEKNPDPLLMIEYYKLKWNAEAASSRDLSGTALKTGARELADIWFLLEQHPDSAPLNEYAVWLFLSQGKVQEAAGIFEKWFYSKYGISGLTFGEEADGGTLSPGDLEGWEREYYALLLALTGRAGDASLLLESLADDSLRAWRALVNLAYLNEAGRNYPRALELYGIAAGMTMDKREKSRIHYRIGRLYGERNDLSHARLSLSYSLSLDPDNYEARLLLKRYQ